LKLFRIRLSCWVLIVACLMLALSCGLKMSPKPRPEHMPGVPSPAPDEVDQGFAVFTPKPMESADPLGLGNQMAPPRNKGEHLEGNTPQKTPGAPTPVPSPSPTPTPEKKTTPNSAGDAK